MTTSGGQWLIEIADPGNPDVVHTFRGATEAEADALVDAAIGDDDPEPDKPQ
jgi:hypothetical protein